jgi:hypothetical protein
MLGSDGQPKPTSSRRQAAPQRRGVQDLEWAVCRCSPAVEWLTVRICYTPQCRHCRLGVAAGQASEAMIAGCTDFLPKLLSARQAVWTIA